MRYYCVFCTEQKIPFTKVISTVGIIPESEFNKSTIVYNLTKLFIGHNFFLQEVSDESINIDEVSNYVIVLKYSVNNKEETKMIELTQKQLSENSIWTPLIQMSTYPDWIKIMICDPNKYKNLLRGPGYVFSTKNEK